MDRLEELKQKYNSALQTIQREGVRLSHLHVQDNKLFIQGAAPSEQIKKQSRQRSSSLPSATDTFGPWPIA